MYRIGVIGRQAVCPLFITTSSSCRNVPNEPSSGAPRQLRGAFFGAARQPLVSLKHLESLSRHHSRPRSFKGGNRV
jgi:hypothetical protein